MPWCEPCSRFLTPSTLRPDGTCPTCGTKLAAPRAATRRGRARAPWHFWLLVGMAALYLGWRAVQGIIWLVHLF